MIYCRFSSNHYQCDVYCYKDICQGYTTHVAFLRYEFTKSMPITSIDDYSADEYVRRHTQVMKQIDTTPQVVIGLSRDGMIFHDDTARQAVQRLQSLASEGYRVPNYAIEILHAEASANFTEGEVPAHSR